MIIDTSALVAMAHGEQGWEAMRTALLNSPGLIPAPVLVEFHRVTALTGNRNDPDAVALIRDLVLDGTQIAAFDAAAAEAAVAANENCGTGNGVGGKLNMLDLMVYGVARTMNLPILCTGKDFAATDAVLHPASRAY